MTWVVWRQHRAEGLMLLVVLAGLGVFLLITGLDMANSFQQSGLSTCLAHATDQSTCDYLERAFQNQYSYLNGLVIFLLLLPLLPGALVGAPLVAREVEQRTHLLVWTQSITRARWLTVQLVLVLGVALLAFGVLLALLFWWSTPLAQFEGRFATVAFDVTGPVWLAGALLALALGIFAGTLTRRVVLAIVLTIALFVAIRVPVEVLWRPNFEPPITVTWPNGQETTPPRLNDQDWLVSQDFGAQANYLTYQPADRFWTFQWIETGIYLGFSLLALFAAFWLVRRRLN
jgi:hypothetical protein